MTVKSLKILLAATALGFGALACCGSADARPRGHGWHYGWHKGWYRDSVVASDDVVAPRRHARRHRHDDCVVAADDDDDLAPRRRTRHHHHECTLAADCDLGPCGSWRDDYVVASDSVDVEPPVYVLPPDYVATPVYEYGYCDPGYSYYAAPVIYAAPVVYSAPVVYPVVYTPSYGPWGYSYGW